MSEINNPKIDLEDIVLVIDVVLGTAPDDGVTLGLNEENIETRWGYLGEEWAGLENSRAFGCLAVIQNNSALVKTNYFYWSEFKRSPDYLLFYWGVGTRNDKKNADKTFNLFMKKSLYITVDDVVYDLGRGEDWASEDLGAMVTYSGADARKLSIVLKKTGEIKRFYCNWRDQ
ncbi:hypothetical protein [Xenorhabdus lircayensis]|uniref:DUF7823 domain-containing protein n=1 Tax=Xenorhabdus lircayensis TaxID=2763499 RepID=A0ABS0U309_9GAMM|nr:hypothetical protein [Xenorhabdus lircayensis]MBI6548249.1 hypothetical protein [Xenorhabdus lircayensis]